MQFPEIDRNLAQRQLALLGHSINKPVYCAFSTPVMIQGKMEMQGVKQTELIGSR